MDFNLTNNCTPSINLGFWGGIEQKCDCRRIDSEIEKPEHKIKFLKKNVQIKKLKQIVKK